MWRILLHEKKKEEEGCTEKWIRYVRLNKRIYNNDVKLHI